jgi:hypothetical protein
VKIFVGTAFHLFIYLFIYFVGIGDILHRNGLIKYVIEGNMYGTGRRRRRGKQLPDDLKEAKKCWKLKEEALDRTLWRILFEGGCDPVVRLRNYDVRNIFESFWSDAKIIQSRCGRLYYRKLKCGTEGRNAIS